MWRCPRKVPEALLIGGSPTRLVICLRLSLPNSGSCANQDVVRQGSSTPGIDRASYEIGERIDEGLRAGRISQREARMLHRPHRAIERHEAAYKSDGVVTQQGRRQLRNELGALRDQVERLINPRG